MDHFEANCAHSTELGGAERLMLQMKLASRLMVALLKIVGIGDLTTVDVVNVNAYCDMSGI